MADKIFAIVRVGRDPSDTHAHALLSQALEMADPDPGDYVEHGVVKASDAGAARLMEPREWRRLVQKDGDWWNVGEGDEIPNRNPARKSMLGDFITREVASTGIQGDRTFEDLVRRIELMQTYEMPLNEMHDAIIADGFSEEAFFLAYQAAKTIGGARRNPVGLKRTGIDNENYTHYVVDKGNKIESGWEYARDAKDQLKNVKFDTAPSSGWRVLTRAGLQRLGVDPGNDSSWYGGARRNPASLTAKGERMYEHVKKGYGRDPRAKEIAARTVYARAADGQRGLVRNPFGKKTAEELTPELQAFEDLFIDAPAYERTALFEAITHAESLKSAKSRGEAVDLVLRDASALLEAKGVEAVIDEDAEVDEYYLECVASYVDRGNPYRNTLIYDAENRMFAVGDIDSYIRKRADENAVR